MNDELYERRIKAQSDANDDLDFLPRSYDFMNEIFTEVFDAGFRAAIELIEKEPELLGLVRKECQNQGGQCG